MTVIARDNVAADSLVYAWPFPIGSECEVSCANDEQVIMCPAWMVGDRLGPGRHLWRTPDPSRPVAAYFVLTESVQVEFDCATSFQLPMNGQPINLRAAGTLSVRCTDPGLLVAQFVGLPFDPVNDGVMKSISRSAERMIARLLTRRVVMAGTPLVITDATMQQPIIDELVAYNPTAGAVFGIELIRLNQIAIHADDGQKQYATPNHSRVINGNGAGGGGNVAYGSQPPVEVMPASQRPTPAIPTESVQQQEAAFMPRRTTVTPGDHELPQPRMEAPTMPAPVGNPQISVSGEIGGPRMPAPQQPQPQPQPQPPQQHHQPSMQATQQGQALGPGFSMASSGGAASAVVSGSIGSSSGSGNSGGGASGVVVSGSIGGGIVSGGGASGGGAVSGSIGGGGSNNIDGVGVTSPANNRERAVASGEIGSNRSAPPAMPAPLAPPPPAPMAAAPAAPPRPRNKTPILGIAAQAKPSEVAAGIVGTDGAPKRRAGSISAQPGLPPIPPPTPPAPAPAPPAFDPTAIRPPVAPATPVPGTLTATPAATTGIGVSQINPGSTANEPVKVKPGGRVLVPGPNGLMQSATVRQLLQGYYELEVGGSGETIWVPIGGVIVEP